MSSSASGSSSSSSSSDDDRRRKKVRDPPALMPYGHLEGTGGFLGRGIGSYSLYNFYPGRTAARHAKGFRVLMGRGRSSPSSKILLSSLSRGRQQPFALPEALRNAKGFGKCEALRIRAFALGTDRSSHASKRLRLTSLSHGRQQTRESFRVMRLSPP